MEYPLSYIVGGEQLLAETKRDWYTEEALNITRFGLQDPAIRPVDTNAMYAVDTPNRFGDGGVMYWDNYFAGLIAGLHSNGDWDFFPEQIKYEYYSLENQPDRPEWTASVKEIIANSGTPASSGWHYIGVTSVPEAPIVFLDAWVFTWGGIEMALVNASNLLQTDEKNDPNPPPAEHTTVYQLSILFITGEEPLVLSGLIGPGPLRERHDIFNAGFYTPPEDREWYHTEWSVVQYDADGGWMICPVYIEGEGYGQARMVMMLADIDGCGTSELITIYTAIYGWITVYKLIDGYPTPVLRLTQFA